MIPFRPPEEVGEPEKEEMTPFLMPEGLDEPEKEGEDTESESGGSLEAEPEPAGALATK